MATPKTFTQQELDALKIPEIPLLRTDPDEAMQALIEHFTHPENMTLDELFDIVRR